MSVTVAVTNTRIRRRATFLYATGFEKRANRDVTIIVPRPGIPAGAPTCAFTHSA
jgi:hypothetical protein